MNFFALADTFTKWSSRICDGVLPLDRFNSMLAAWRIKYASTEDWQDDFFWQMFNERIQSIANAGFSVAKRTDFLYDTYVMMMEYFAEFKPGTPNVVINKQRILLEEIYYATRDLDTVVGIRSFQACESCINLVKSEYTLREALEIDPLPKHDCVNSYGCSCVYWHRLMEDDL